MHSAGRGGGGLCLDYKKCHFASRQITILGHIVNEFGKQPDSEKVKAIVHFPKRRRAMYANWADRVESLEMEFTSVVNKEPKGFKRKGDSQDKPEIPKTDTIAVRLSQPPRRTTRDPVTQLKNSQQALSKSRLAAASFDQCCYN
ncbi:K02A2.6-like [Cordylochernes scorpioides]|uniref:K02A2.6-like n=1 Tax=Cordylochernes scorpioides TaxID=51811 RepID=A0ABY6KA24_9ARAC|nr:K02A2.6-like [Cordylochernes scorpioides]